MSERFYIEPHKDKYQEGFVVLSTHKLDGKPRGCCAFFKTKEEAVKWRDRWQFKENEKARAEARRKRKRR